MFAIELPLEPEHVSTARIFASAIARHFSCHPADIEDLKIALSEACNSTISRSGAQDPGAVCVSAVRIAGFLKFEISGPGPAQGQSPPGPGQPATQDHMMALSAGLIAALFPDARFIDAPSGSSFWFSLPAGTPAA